MRYCHGRCSPERNHKSQIKGMPDIFIEEWGPKRKCFIRLSNKIEPNLSQTEEVEMINEESADQYYTKAE